MTNENKAESGEGTPMPENGATNEAAPRASASEGGAGVSDEVARLKIEVADLKDRLLRSHAEMDNFRKRLEKDKAEATKYAISKFAKDVVGIGDNVQRAIEAVPKKALDEDPQFKGFFDGVSMIEREFLSILERHGVKEIAAKGEPFNPHFHQAVMEMPVENVPSGTVTQVFQTGYTLEDRVLRPAMVVVAKGGMKPQAQAARPAEANDDEERDDGYGGAG